MALRTQSVALIGCRTLVPQVILVQFLRDLLMYSYGQWLDTTLCLWSRCICTLTVAWISLKMVHIYSHVPFFAYVVKAQRPSHPPYYMARQLRPHQMISSKDLILDLGLAVGARQGGFELALLQEEGYWVALCYPWAGLLIRHLCELLKPILQLLGKVTPLHSPPPNVMAFRLMGTAKVLKHPTR